MKPSAGRIVLYVSEKGIRPAIVVCPSGERFPLAVYKRDECQLHVFFDGRNDDGRNLLSHDPEPQNPWRTSVPHDENKALGTWHWPPRAPSPAPVEAPAPSSAEKDPER